MDLPFSSQLLGSTLPSCQHAIRVHPIQRPYRRTTIVCVYQHAMQIPIPIPMEDAIDL